MNIMMMTALPGKDPMAVGETVGLGGIKDGMKGESFSSYLEESQAAGKSNGNLLGVENPHGSENELDVRLAQIIEEEDITTIPGLLEQMMLLLQEQAEKVNGEPGQWLFSLPDTGLLEQLAQKAGMNEDEIVNFLKVFEAGEESTLGRLLFELADHFSQLTEKSSVTVPDTDFPAFAALLSKMGVSIKGIENIASQVITGEDLLDLGLLAAALGELGEFVETKTETSAITLSDWDVEQLSNILQQAGLTEEDLRSLTIPVPREKASFDLPKLAEFLSRAVEQIEAAKPKADGLAFLNKLGELFNEAGFQEKTAGWTPILLKSVESIYQQLLETVDLSKVRVQVMQTGPVQKPAAEIVTAVMGITNEEGFDPEGDFFGAPGEGEGEQSFRFVGENSDSRVVPESHFPDSQANQASLKGDLSTATVINESGGDQNSVQGVKEPAPLPRTAQVNVQQTIDQLTQAVAQGANRNEHHLIIKLYPENLGEVKVNLHVRDEHISISFTMENGRVKDILESNMQQFRDSLEKHGFNLGDLSASVNQQDQADEGWQRFEEFAKGRLGDFPKENITDLPDDALYRRPSWVFSENEIDLFV